MRKSRQKTILCGMIGISALILALLTVMVAHIHQKDSSNEETGNPSIDVVEPKAYVFFKSFTFIQIFNKLDIQPRYMYIYSSSLSLVPHSLIHKLTLNQ